MNKSNLLVITSLSISLLGLSACGKDLKSYAKAVSKELGVPIAVKTDNNDVCARRQLDQVVEDYRKLSSDERDAVKQFARHYKTVTINATAETARITGEVTVLQLTADNPFTGGKVIDTKILADKRKTEGTAPKTQVQKNETALVITTQDAFDDSDTATYWTDELALFGVITNVDDGVLERSVGSHAVAPKGTKKSTMVDCGTLVGLRDLL